MGAINSILMKVDQCSDHHLERASTSGEFREKQQCIIVGPGFPHPLFCLFCLSLSSSFFLIKTSSRMKAVSRDVITVLIYLFSLQLVCQMNYYTQKPTEWRCSNRCMPLRKLPWTGQIHCKKCNCTRSYKVGDASGGQRLGIAEEIKWRRVGD